MATRFWTLLILVSIQVFNGHSQSPPARLGGAIIPTRATAKDLGELELAAYLGRFPKIACRHCLVRSVSPVAARKHLVC